MNLIADARGRRHVDARSAAGGAVNSLRARGVVERDAMPTGWL
jgi:hypothetical protein